MAVKQFSEVSGEPDWEYDQIDFASLVGKKVIVQDFFLRKSNYDETRHYAIIWIKLAKKDYRTISGSGVILDQLEKIKPELPVECGVDKVKDYYTFK